MSGATQNECATERYTPSVIPRTRCSSTSVHQPVGLEALDVVVDGLRRVAENLADLRAGARLGELAQHLDPLGLQQRVGLLDRLDVERVQHLQPVLYVKASATASFERSRENFRRLPGTVRA